MFQSSAKPAPLRVLVRLTGTLGDALVSLPALRALRAHFGKKAEFHLLYDDHPVRTPVPEFFQVEPHFAKTFAYPKTLGKLAKLRRLASLARQLRSQHYAAAVLITSCTLSRWTVRAERRFLRAAGITQFIGFADPATEKMLPHDAAGRALETQRDLFWRLERLDAEGVATKSFAPKDKPFLSLDARMLAPVDAWLRAHDLQAGSFWVVAPFTGSPAKDWAPGHWEELFKTLSRQTSRPLVVLGSQTQREAAGALTAHWQGVSRNACGELELGASLGVLARAHAFIGLDALPAHAAGALGIPGVVIFKSPSHPGQWVPWSPEERLRIILAHSKPSLPPPAGKKAANETILADPVPAEVLVALRKMES